MHALATLWPSMKWLHLQRDTYFTNSVEQTGESSAAQLTPLNAPTVPVQQSEQTSITQQSYGNLFKLFMLQSLQILNIYASIRGVFIF